MNISANTIAKTAGVRGGYFKPRRLAHVNLWVNDYEKSAQFYTDIVGIEEAYRREYISGIFMSNGNTYHDMAVMDINNRRGAGKTIGMHHFALELENEALLVDGFNACKHDGFDFDFTISADVTNSAYGSDPDGNRFEVYADVVEDWRSERSGALTTGGRKWIPGETPPLAKSLYPVNPEIIVVKDAVFNPVRTSHVVLIAKDYAAMLNHYTEIVGMQLLAGGIANEFAVFGGLLAEESVTIFKAAAGEKIGMHHYGMELASEKSMDASIEKLKQCGMTLVAEFDHATRRSVTIADPDGILIQFYINREINYQHWLALPRYEALLLA